MRISTSRLRRAVAFGLVMTLAVPLAEAAGATSQMEIGGQQAKIVASATPEAQSSGGGTVKAETVTSGSNATPPDNSSPVQTQSAPQGELPATSQSATEKPQQATPKPVGSAAAPFETTTGVAASRPAGAAIAPAKQRRAGSILIRMSIVVGAAVAIGTVVALSHGSSSRPN